MRSLTKDSDMDDLRSIASAPESMIYVSWFFQNEESPVGRMWFHVTSRGSKSRYAKTKQNDEFSVKTVFINNGPQVSLDRGT